MTRPSGHNGFHNNSLNSSDNGNGPTCVRCGEQGHMRLECSKETIYCTHCRTPNHDTKACRKHHNNTLSPTNRLPPNSNTTTTTRNSTNNWDAFTTDRYKHQWTLVPRTILTRTNLEPVPPSTHPSTAHHQHHQPT